MTDAKRYCLDANIFIEGWNKYYSMDLNPGYWEILDRLAQEGRVFSPIEVKREILQNDGTLSDWIKSRPYMFKDITDDVQKELRKIMADYPTLVDSIKQRSIADPWVIAFAITEDAVVVTKEMPAGNNSKRIKIPDVCNGLGVPWIDDFQFAREIGMRFTAQISS